MKIAYLTHYDPQNIKFWSGTGYFIGQELRRQGLEVDDVGPLRRQGITAIKLKQKYYRRFARKTFMGEVNATLLKGYGRDATQKITRISPDVIFAPNTFSVAHLDASRPIALWIDCTFAGMVDFYPDYCNLCAESLRDGDQMERLALARTKLAIFASDWAAQSAIKHYGFDSAKTAVVPYGANIICSRTAGDIENYIAARSPKTCNLLFIGKIWGRKGGDLAVDVARKLNEAGLPTKLTLIGSAPPTGTPLPDYVRSLGFISKATEEGRRQIDSLIGESHFLIVPSRAEAYGIVFCEASSFGVPSLTTNVGGIPTVVRDGRNGRTFSHAASPDEYCQYVLDLMRRYHAYKDLARSAFNEYQTRLNWHSAGASVKKLLQQL